MKGLKEVYQIPEIFLTLGAPGDNIRIPLTPVFGRPLSIDLNLIPKKHVKSRHCSSSHASPRKSHSRPSSPYRGTSTKPVTLAISPDEDCFSLINKIHTAQLLKGMTQGGQNTKEEKEKTEQRKGKGTGKKDKKND